MGFLTDILITKGNLDIETDMKGRQCEEKDEDNHL